ncbi:MAG: phosphatase PAP2 family protein [Dehalococcoidia bacterium]
MTSPDSQLSEWITGLVGKVYLWDTAMTLLASDFFIPVCISLFLLYLWFGTRDPVQRVKNQHGAMCASASLGLGCLGVQLLNNVGLDPWLRPFEVSASAGRAAEVIFYQPYDPSFPANMAAVGFGAATGMWFYRRKSSIPLFIFASLWSLARVYAGVHYPLDILGGAVIGVFMACFSYGLIRLFWFLPAICFWLARKLYLA